MNYRETLAWLFAARSHGIKPGLDATRQLLLAAGSPERNLRFVHVAGTNGKGSVCAMCEAILRAGGHRAGLYISPHLVTFRERVRVGGELISEAAVAECAGRLRAAGESLGRPPTFFEWVTVLALSYFRETGADPVVLETGLGGRLDSTNVVTPAVSVITAIDMDHTAWLGPDLAAIAGEKAGILKPGVPCLSAPQAPEAERVLRRVAAERGAPIRFVSEPWLPGPVALAGSHQRLNAALAVAALEAGGFAPSPEAAGRGLAEVRWPGRFEQVGRWIIDGAHNPAAAARLAHTWRETMGDARPTLLLGMMADKDVAGICRALAPLASAVICTQGEGERWLAAAELAARVRGGAPGLPVEACPGVEAAMHFAEAHEGELLAAGSLFLAGEMLGVLLGETPESGFL